MLALYLIVVWFLFTLFWAGSRKLRHSAPVFLVWFGLTSVMLWPVVRRAYESPELRAIADQVHQEWSVELEREFGRPVSVEEF